jgi:hypothetical protein
LSLFLRLPQPGGPGSCIYFPQEQGSPVISPDIELIQSIRLLAYHTTWTDLKVKFHKYLPTVIQTLHLFKLPSGLKEGTM